MAAEEHLGNRFRGIVTGMEAGRHIRVRGVHRAQVHGTLEFDNGATALVTDLLEDGTVVASPLREPAITAESRCRAGPGLTIPTGFDLRGRVVSPFGEPLDSAPLHLPGSSIRRPIFPLPKAPLSSSSSRSAPASGAGQHTSSKRALPAGFPALDALSPLTVSGQHLLIAPPGVHGTDVALDIVSYLASAIKHSAAHADGAARTGALTRPVICLVGLSRAETARRVRTLREEGTLAQAVVVAAPADTPPAEQFLAPFASLALAAQLCDEGHDSVLTVTNLYKHAAVAAAIHPHLAPESATLHGAVADATAARPPASKARSVAGSITLLAVMEQPLGSGHAEQKRIKDLCRSSAEHFATVWRLSPEAGPTASRPPVPALVSGQFHGSAHQGSAMMRVGAEAARLLREAGEVASATASAEAMGVSAEMQTDGIRGLYARLHLLLARNADEWSVAQQSRRTSDSETGNAIARMAVSADASESGGDPVEREVESISMGKHRGVPRISSTVSGAGGVAAAREAYKKRQLAKAQNAGNQQPKVAAAAATAADGDETESDVDVRALIGRESVASAAGRRRGAGGMAASSGMLASTRRPSPAQTHAMLLAVVHGYASVVPLCHLAEFEARLLRVLASLPDPEGLEPTSRFAHLGAAGTSASDETSPVPTVPTAETSRAGGLGFGGFQLAGDNLLDEVGSDSSASQSLLQAAAAVSQSTSQSLSRQRSAAEVAEFAQLARRKAARGHITVPVAVDLQPLPPALRAMHRVTAAVAEAVTNRQ